MTLILIGLTSSGCAMSRYGDAFDSMFGPQTTGSIRAPGPTDGDLTLARDAAANVLTKGDKYASQPWENPQTGARGSVTPLAQAYSSDGRTCRDFLASYVNGRSEKWLQGAACQSGHGRWQIQALKPWNQS